MVRLLGVHKYVTCYDAQGEAKFEFLYKLVSLYLYHNITYIVYLFSVTDFPYREEREY